MKENVEKSILAKEEIIIDVPLSAIQKKLYKALLEKDFAILKGGKGFFARNPNLKRFIYHNTKKQIL